MAMTVEQHPPRIQQFARAYPDPDANPILRAGRAGRTAQVVSIGVTWAWDQDAGGWRAVGVLNVTQADHLKGGGTGELYVRQLWAADEGENGGQFAELIAFSRPPVRVVLEPTS